MIILKEYNNNGMIRGITIHAESRVMSSRIFSLLIGAYLMKQSHNLDIAVLFVSVTFV